MFKLYTSVSGLRKNTMQSCCGLPLRTCDVCHFPSLRTLRFCLSPFSSISSTSLSSSSSSSYSSSSSSSSSSYGDGRVSLALPIESPKGLISKPRPRVALLSLLLVLSMFALNQLLLQAFATFLSLAILSIPTIKAIRRLASSTEQLAKVVSQEVPGTLTSLRLSGLEIHQLARQLATLRQLLSSSPLSKRHRCSKSSSSTNKE